MHPFTTLGVRFAAKKNSMSHCSSKDSYGACLQALHTHIYTNMNKNVLSKRSLSACDHQQDCMTTSTTLPPANDFFIPQNPCANVCFF